MKKTWKSLNWSPGFFVQGNLYIDLFIYYFFMKTINIILFAFLIFGCSTSSEKSKYIFEISFTSALSEENIDGRLLLMISNNNDKEPRFQINDGLNTQLIFGIDVEKMKPGAKIKVDATVFGFPKVSLDEISEGNYYVQALLNRYKTFHLSTGHSIKLPPDKGEGQQWNRKPGNFYSNSRLVRMQEGGKYHIEMNLEIPSIEPPKDTRYIKHVKMKSDLLSKFWGTDMFLGANVLLPHGFDEHPEAKYPLMIFHGHFPYTFRGFRETPPDPNLTPEYNSRFGIEGYNKIVQKEAHDFYNTWISDDFPRFIVIEIQHANPYYDDSYAVNSANLGPYGDAITYELIPFIEKQFRGQGKPWSRFLYGGSTGGWEALAAQVFYPSEYNGCFAACPDPIDFRAYCLIDIYEDKNAYYYQSDHKQTLKPGHRDYRGQVSSTIQDMNWLELVLGTKSRSGGQFDIWEAVYSPMGEDGYPQRLWDKKSGVIDHEVASHWRANYDLRHILERDWEELGSELQGKIHIYCGDMDNYYLNNAVYLMEEFLESTNDPYYDGEVDYGDRAEHCWNGDHENPNYISRLRYNTLYLPRIMKRIATSAPEGSDLTSWRY